MSKAVTLICATAPLANGAATTNPCTINAGSNTVLGINGFSGTSNKLYRVSGFQFVNSNAGAGAIWFDTCNPGCRGQLTNIRIDHNTFTASSQAISIALGDTQSYGYYYGVVDHNTINAATSGPLYMWWALEDSAPPSSPLGTTNNLFLEDNIFNNQQLAGYESTPCFSDSWGSTASVIRHNTIYNCLVPVHGIDHNGGPQNWEVYDNAFIFNSGASGSSFSDGYRMVHHQGSGEEIFFNNTFAPLSEPHNSSTLSITANYVDNVCSGVSYPCARQPGRDFAGGGLSGTGSAGNLMPIYSWNNVDTNNGTMVKAAAEASNTFVAPNRDYYDAVSTNANASPSSPFNGTVGVGFGTLTNRPTTCTHSNPTYPTRSPQDDGHGGVGYFATDVGPQGTLYTCTATNTWKVYYTPYTYPHPLVSGTSGGGTAPNAPTSLSAIVQ
jgi:hypothetical protein